MFLRKELGWNRPNQTVDPKTCYAGLGDFFVFHLEIMSTDYTKKISEGRWNDNVSWEFYLSKKVPDKSLVNAVFSIPIYDNNIALTKSHRGWEIPWGHVEKWESFEEALFRETEEEIWCKLLSYEMIWFRKIINKQPVKKPNGDFYPLIGYVPHYIWKIGGEPLQNPIWEEILEARLFSYEELKEKDFWGMEFVRFLIIEGII